MTQSASEERHGEEVIGSQSLGDSLQPRGEARKGDPNMAFASWDRLAWFAPAALAFNFTSSALGQTRSNPNCPTETVFFDPGSGQDIAVPEGFKVSVFAKDLNFPTGIVFQGNGKRFNVFVIESGKGLP